MSFARGEKDCPLAIYRDHYKHSETRFSPAHWHPQMEINFITRGTFTVSSLAGETRIGPGDFYLIPPEEIHSVRCDRDDSFRITVNFSPELITVPEGHFFFEGFLRPLREGILRIPRCLHPGDPGYEGAKRWYSMLESAEETKPDYKSQLFMGAMGFCLSLMPLCRIVAPDEENVLSGSKGNDIVRRCQKYIGRHYGSPLTLQTIADQVHVHPNYLCRIFKEYAGQPIFEYINSIRISFATQFIRNTDQTIPQIAERCGFNSMSYFVKRFKLYTGLTPHAYSKLYKNG